MKGRSLSFRLVSWYAFWLGIVFVLASVLVYFGLRHYLEGNLAATQTQRALRIAALVSRVGTENRRGLGEEITARFAPEASERFIRVVGLDGTILYQSDRPHDGNFDPKEISAPALAPAAEP